jgi:hypothetical protein
MTRFNPSSDEPLDKVVPLPPDPLVWFTVTRTLPGPERVKHNRSICGGTGVICVAEAVMLPKIKIR